MRRLISGNASACAAALEGALRYDSAGNTLGYCDGTTWQTVSTGGSTGLWSDNTTHISYESAHMLKIGETMTTAGFDGGPTQAMLWYPDKYAFRVGKVTSTQWDNTNIGLGSFAQGLNNRAIGVYSVAMGSGALASNGYSIAMGQAVTASGANSVVFGYNATASGQRAGAIGYNTTASGQGGMAFGTYTTASGLWSTAMGVNAVADGSGSTAIGHRVNALGDYSLGLGLGFATGAYPQVTGNSSVGIFMGSFEFRVG